MGYTQGKKEEFAASTMSDRERRGAENGTKKNLFQQILIPERGEGGKKGKKDRAASVVFRGEKGKTTLLCRSLNRFVCKLGGEGRREPISERTEGGGDSGETP